MSSADNMRRARRGVDHCALAVVAPFVDGHGRTGAAAGFAFAPFLPFADATGALVVEGSALRLRTPAEIAEASVSTALR
jgi:hypothetical protein